MSTVGDYSQSHPGDIGFLPVLQDGDLLTRSLTHWPGMEAPLVEHVYPSASGDYLVVHREAAFFGEKDLA